MSFCSRRVCYMQEVCYAGLRNGTVILLFTPEHDWREEAGRRRREFGIFLPCTN